MSNDAEKILPYVTSELAKGEQIEQMFDSIAPQYDLLNHTLSLGIDRWWRKKGLLQIKKSNPQTILDIATGTGDLAIKASQLLTPKSILGIDISDGMMDVARTKVAELKLSTIISFQKQDCMSLALANNSFDAAIVAFGVRNFEDLEKGLKEILRVLNPGGKLMILELTTPQSFPMKQLYNLYSKTVIPHLGKFISKSRTAYNYLPQTINAFVQGEDMKEVLYNCGFAHVSYTKYTFGICTMYLAKK